MSEENKPMISPEAAGTIALVGVIMAFLALVGVYRVNNMVVETAVGAGSADATIGMAQNAAIEELRHRIEAMEKGGAAASGAAPTEAAAPTDTTAAATAPASAPAAGAH